MTSRRQFIGSAATALALRPLFSRNYLFGAPPLAGTDGYVHLNFNENPYGPSDKALQAIRDAATIAARYPDLSNTDIRSALAKEHGLARENIVMGAGSTEILKICDDIFLSSKPRLVAAEPAYEAVIRYAINSRAGAIKIPLTKDYRHDLMKMADAVTPQTGLVYICNPNNPTGTIVTKDELQQFMKRVPDSVPVVVDEAYSHFAGSAFESAIQYVKQGRSVIVTRTFSKAYGLAGMRIGYAIARRDLIDRMMAFGVDFAVTGLATRAALAALSDVAYLQSILEMNAIRRQALYDEMRALKFECIPSHTNFVMIQVRTSVGPVIREFANHKLLVGREFPPLLNFLRVSMGTEEEMKKFVAAFRQIFHV